MVHRSHTFSIGRRKFEAAFPTRLCSSLDPLSRPAGDSETTDRSSLWSKWPVLPSVYWSEDSKLNFGSQCDWPLIGFVSAVIQVFYQRTATTSHLEVELASILESASLVFWRRFCPKLLHLYRFWYLLPLLSQTFTACPSLSFVCLKLSKVTSHRFRH